MAKKMSTNPTWSTFSPQRTMRNRNLSKITTSVWTVNVLYPCTTFSLLTCKKTQFMSNWRNTESKKSSKPDYQRKSSKQWSSRDKICKSSSTCVRKSKYKKKMPMRWQIYSNQLSLQPANVSEDCQLVLMESITSIPYLWWVPTRWVYQLSREKI